MRLCLQNAHFLICFFKNSNINFCFCVFIFSTTISLSLFLSLNLSESLSLSRTIFLTQFLSHNLSLSHSGLRPATSLSPGFVPQPLSLGVVPQPLAVSFWGSSRSLSFSLGFVPQPLLVLASSRNSLFLSGLGSASGVHACVQQIEQHRAAQTPLSSPTSYHACVALSVVNAVQSCRIL